jgi:predicted permease
MIGDMHLAWRSLTRPRQRWPVAAAAAILGFSVGANASLLAILDAVVFRPLPFRDVDRLVSIQLSPSPSFSSSNRQAVGRALVETPLLEARAEARPAILFEEGADVGGESEPRAVQVTPEFFSLFGMTPELGRLLGVQDQSIADPRPIVISHRFWQSRFGGDPTIVGRIVELPALILERRVSVVGVLTRGREFPIGTDIWVLTVSRQSSIAPDYARLAEGVTVAKLRAVFPHVDIQQLVTAVRPRASAGLVFLLFATGLMLLIAWVQVASFLVIRNSRRSLEFGVRVAIGATRWHLLRQLLAEGTLLSFGSLALALTAIPSMTAALIRILPPEVSAGRTIEMGLPPFLFAAALAVLGVVVVSVAPLPIVIRSIPRDLMTGRALLPVPVKDAQLRSSLLVVQLALTTTLLYMTGLALRSLERINAVDLGFKTENAFAFTLPPTTVVGATAEQRRLHINRQVQRFNDLLDALRALPNADAVGGGRVPFATPSPMSAKSYPIVPVGGRPIEAILNYATPGYVRALGLRLREGREPTEQDLYGENLKALASTSLARELVVFGSVVGQVVTANSRSYEVIGVVEDFVLDRPDVPAEPQAILYGVTIVSSLLARFTTPTEQSIAALRTTFERMLQGHPNRRITDLTEDARRVTAEYRARSGLLSLVVVFTLPLAMAGIAGTLSFATNQRRREIAVHLALGAAPIAVRRSVVRAALIYALAGLSVGMAGGVLASRSMSAYLFGVATVDPTTITGVGLALLLVSWTASLLPARQASRIDPAVMLRES